MKGQVMRKIYRQGDVLLELVVDEIPIGVEIRRTRRGLVLQEGEVTGHAHRIAQRSAKLYRTEEDARYMRVTAPVKLEHEEHSTVTIPVGTYRVSIHSEYQPGALPRRVVD